MKPKNWPGSFIYTPTSISNEVHPQLLDILLQSKDLSDKNRVCKRINEQKIHPDLKILKVKENHPLQGEYGLFATKSLDAYTILGEYAGEYLFSLEDRKKISPSSLYHWEFSFSGSSLFIYAGKYANEIVYVNDYRSIATSPNTFGAWTPHKGRYYFVYITNKRVQKGEEILVDYGYLWEEFYLSK